MKKPILLFSLLFVIVSAHSQNKWEDFTKTADSLDLKMQFNASLSFREKALKAAKNQPDSIQKMLLGLQMFTRAEHNFNKGSQAYSEAYELMQNAVDTLRKANATAEIISKAYWDLNLAAFNYMGNQKDTEAFLNKSIEYHLKSSKLDTLFLLNTMHGSIYMGILSGNYEKSIETFKKGIELFDQYQVKEDKDKNLKGYLYANMSLLYSPSFLDVPHKHLQYLEEEENVFSSMDAPDLDYFIGTYIQLSILKRAYGNFRRAEGYLNRALKLYENNKEQLHSGSFHYVGFRRILEIYQGLIILYRETGDEIKMLEILSKVEAIHQNNELNQTQKNQYAGILRGVGRYYLHQDYSFDEAREYFNKALEINIEKTTIHAGKTKTGLTLDLANAYFYNKDYSKTLDIIEQVEETEVLEPYQIELKIKTLFKLNRFEDAVSGINQLLRVISDENNQFDFLTSPLNDFTPGFVITDAEGLADVAKFFQDHNQKFSLEAEKLYWIALAQFENNIGNTPLNKTLKNTFDKITSGLMNAGLERSFSSEENNRLLNFMETVSSQNLINQFLLKREIAGNTKAYKLVEEEQYLRSYITFLKKEYQKSKDEALKQQLFEKEIELEKISEQLTAQYKSSNPFTTPKVEVTTVNDKNIIQFTVANNQLFKIRLYNGSISYQKIDDYPSLKQEIENYLININDLNSEVSKLKKQGEALFHKLFSDDFNTDVPVVIIPDDILHYLPFELLVKNKEYLIENHTISYAPNFYFLKSGNTIENNYRNKKVAFFAPEYSGNIPESQLAVRGEAYSLFGAEEEVSEIAKFISGNIYLGNSASKTQFKSLDGDISILHLAMHSNLNDKDPELSNLVFSDSEQDYEMYISELYGLNFNAGLAVLSACNTGVGGFKDGGNLVSMHHAFTTAGIPATVASLWNAPDLSTKEIMVSFYKNLKKGQDKATALQNAKLIYLKNAKDENLQHPFYWAGFVLSGDNSPIQLEGKPLWQTHSIIVAIIVLLLVAILYFYIRKRNQKVI
tara:strand:- start:229927 stop:232977 length:3051 start_codon:yes stop_codon:yes gene_type:complete